MALGGRRRLPIRSLRLVEIVRVGIDGAGTWAGKGTRGRQLGCHGFVRQLQLVAGEIWFT